MLSPLRSLPLEAILGLALLVSLPACGEDAVGPDNAAREVGVVVNSTDISLTVFDVDDPTSSETIGLGADGSPVSVAVRGRFAAVPLGIVPAVAIVEVEDGALLRTVGLPEGSGATGAAFVNDSIVLVANPGLGSVSPVNVLAGTVGSEIAVGRYPQAVVVEGGRAYVVNAELENFAPDGPSSITVLDAAGFAVLDTIELSGENASQAAVGPDGRLYVVHSGSWGASNGAVSVVDLASGSEVDFVEGFGDFPGSVVVDEDGLVYVGAFDLGTLVWSSTSGSFVRDLDEPVTPGGVASTSGLGIDSEDRVYALSPDCQSPALVHRLDESYSSEAAIAVGICPLAIVFTVVDG